MVSQGAFVCPVSVFCIHYLDQGCLVTPPPPFPAVVCYRELVKPGAVGGRRNGRAPPGPLCPFCRAPIKGFEYRVVSAGRGRDP